MSELDTERRGMLGSTCSANRGTLITTADESSVAAGHGTGPAPRRIGHGAGGARPRRAGRRSFADAPAGLRSRLAPATCSGTPRTQGRRGRHVHRRRRAQPVAERGGVLTVRCSSAVRAAELSLLSADLLRRLNEGRPRRARTVRGALRGGRLSIRPHGSTRPSIRLLRQLQ